MPPGPPLLCRRRSSLECSAASTPSVPRLVRSRFRRAQGALGSPAGPRGGGDKRPRAAGWGWGQDFALCLSPEPPAETRPHERARQPARGRLPLRGPLVNPDPTSLWSGL